MKGLIPIISQTYSTLGLNYENICKQVIGGKLSPSSLIDPTGSYDESKIKFYLCTLCVGYNIDDQDKTALYTCNYAIIEQMNNAGYLVDANMDAVAKALSSEAMAKKVKTNGYYGVRLDFEGMVNGKPQYSVKVRHSLVEANKFLVVPLMFYFIYFSLFNQLASKCPVEVVTSWDGVDTKKVITTSSELLKRAYAKASPQAVANKIKYGYVGVHPKTFHICGYSVQSSLDSVAPASFSLRAYKDINFVQKIDTSGNNVSDAYIYLYYRNCIMKQLKLGSKASFQFMNMRKNFNIEDGKDINDTARNWFIFAKRMPANQLYTFMMQYPQVFGSSVQAGIDNEMKKQKAITEGTLELPVDISKSEVDERFVTGVTKMLSSGAVQILYQSKSGNYSSMILTNNIKVLESYYGENYVGEFESTGIRLAFAKKMLMDGGTIKEADTKCKFLEVLGLQIGELTPSECVSEITHYLENKKYAKPKNPFIVSCRSLTASNSSDLWKSIDIRRIKECKYFM